MTLINLKREGEKNERKVALSREKGEKKEQK